MSPVTELSDVDVRAISLVRKGANRQRIFLYKCDDDVFTDDDLMQLNSGTLFKNSAGDDWTTVYAVVAEPGKLEDPGRTGTMEDRWRDEDEILKAAHRFMKNGALINKMHASLDPVGDLVENAVALEDIKLPTFTIKKGSWYIGIQPHDDARESIDKGELEGISIEGIGTRTEVEKAPVLCPKCSATVAPGDQECPKCGYKLAAPVGIKKELWEWFTKTHAGENAAGPIRHLVAHYMKMPHPFTSCVRDNRKRFGDRAENICAGLKDIGTQTHNWRGKDKKLAKDDESTQVDSDVLTARIGVCENLWASHRLDESDAILALQAIAHREGMNESKLSKALHKIGKAVGLPDADLAELDQPDEPTDDHEEDQVGLTKEETDRLDKLEKAIEDRPTLEQITEVVQKAVKPEEKEPTAEELHDELRKMDSKFDELTEKVIKLGEGSSSTEDDEGTNGSREKVKKSDPLAGLLLDS